jgi:signal transduction histidine kinase
VAARRVLRATTPETVVAVAATKQVSIDQAHRPHAARTARRALHRQDRLVSNIAHDLRTPLTAIYEFARLMTSGLGGEINEKQRRYVGIIERRCQEAARMLDDLLDGAKLQSGRIHPHRQAVSLGDILADVNETLEPVVQHSGVHFSMDVADDLPRVFADRDMLGRILGNLISNALKFSPPDGAVTVRAERQSVSLARISVIDTGDGIAPEELRRIFRPFEQGPNRARNGVGLGLSIVRELVRLHGGRVTAESTPGKGSRFHFTLPLFIPAAIVRRYLTTLTKRNAPSITAWSFTCPQPERYDAIHRLISCSVPAADLVLPDDANRRIVLFTQHEGPDLLVGQLVQHIRSLSASVPTVHRLGSVGLDGTLGVSRALGQISNLPGLLAG